MSKFNDIKLPENIDEITNVAIIKGEKYKKRKLNRNINIVLAASLALFLTIGVSFPALAEKVPFVSNVFEYLNKDDSLSSKLFFIKGGSQYKYATAVNQSVMSNGISMTINEVVCDGANIFVSYIVKSDKPFMDSKYDGLGIGKKVIMGDFYDKNLFRSGLSGLQGKYIDEFTFVGMDSINLMPLIGNGVEIPDKFKLNISIGEIKQGYEKSEETINGPWKFKIDVNKNTDYTKIIKPNVEEGGIKINKILLTPMTTDIEYELPNTLPGNPHPLVRDDKGSKLTPDGGEGIVKSQSETIQVMKFAPISKDSKYIIIKFVDKSKQELPVLCEFKIPIE